MTTQYSGLVLDGQMTGQHLTNPFPMVNVPASQDETSFTKETLVRVVVPGRSALTGVWLREKNRQAFLSDQTAYLARRLASCRAGHWCAGAAPDAPQAGARP